MFNVKESKPVDIVIVEHTYIEGKLVEQGTELKQVPIDLALELAAAGKAAAADSDVAKAIVSRAKAAKKAAAAAPQQPAAAAA